MTRGVQVLNHAAAPFLKRSALGWQSSMSEQASQRRDSYSASGVSRESITRCNAMAVLVQAL